MVMKPIKNIRTKPATQAGERVKSMSTASDTYQIKMLETQKAVRTGEVYPTTFIKDSTYNVCERLHKVLLENGWAEDFTPEPEEEVESVDLEEMTKAELIAYCESLNLDPPDRFNKTELKEFIEAHFEDCAKGGAPENKGGTGGDEDK